jgi:hypothetical protein
MSLWLWGEYTPPWLPRKSWIKHRQRCFLRFALCKIGGGFWLLSNAALLMPRMHCIICMYLYLHFSIIHKDSIRTAKAYATVSLPVSLESSSQLILNSINYGTQVPSTFFAMMFPIQATAPPLHARGILYVPHVGYDD